MYWLNKKFYIYFPSIQIQKMDKNKKLLKKDYIFVNKNINNQRPKTTKERIQDLINQNEDNIKKYEKLKAESVNPKKREEYAKIICKYRSQQVKLHNRLYSINLFLNMYMKNLKKNSNNNKINNIPKPKVRVNISNNLYLKQYFNNKINSSMQPNYNYSHLFTNNSNLKKNTQKIERMKFNSSINSLMDKKNIITNTIKKISLINNRQKEINNKNNNNKAFYKVFLNTSTQTRPNIDYGHNSSLITSSSSKFDSNKAKNKYITQPINENNKLYHSKKNIFIINNINNYYNNFMEKIKSNSTKTNNNNMKNITYHIINKTLRKRIKDKILKYNIIDEDEQLDINLNYDEEKKNGNNKNNKKIMNENIEFNSNPNLILSQRFFKIKNNAVLEIYYSYHDNNDLHIALSEKSILGYTIKIIKFKEKKFVTRLKKHNNTIIIIKHFFNKVKMHDFLISGDMDHVVNVWDVSYKYYVNQNIYNIIYNGKNIYNLFNVSIEENNNISNYLLIYDTTVNFYQLNDGKFIKNVNHYPSKEEKIINLIIWKNKENYLDYIIKCTRHKIIIFNFIDEDIYFELSNYLKDNKNNGNNSLCYKSEGCIVSDDKIDLLCILSSSMNLEIWNLYNLSLKIKISIGINFISETYLYNIIPWNNKFILLIDGNENYIYCIDVIINKVVSKIIGCFKNNIRQIYCKKIINNVYGESLLTWCYNRYLSLFSPNNFSLKIFDD